MDVRSWFSKGSCGHIGTLAFLSNNADETTAVGGSKPFISKINIAYIILHAFLHLNVEWI